ncbi:arabinan endo-1,5-alpha-L-arabinosidase [Anaerobacillus alkaliphilus]|uniref:Arabinan endo-1,5-alpha-L-arabinosidase n=1 Tax=Anaerobacillus alkaliphilus TaxID=1548597 RepID=A0A4Q0VQS6_9BACI|nr:arabinan endo-1,5-alpha-L-arabinosidase [Anaerobacillus alkaliphilus]
MSNSLPKRIYIVIIILVIGISAIYVAKDFSAPTELHLEQEQILQENQLTFQNVAVHDPSIIKVDDTYYVFGSHVEAAKSNDLQKWTRFTNGYTTPNNKLYGDLVSNLAESFAWAGHNDSDSKGGFSVWAPEIIWNEDYINEDGTNGAFMMYYSASSTYIRSAIGFAVAQNIEGPFHYVDTVVYSGFTENDAYDQDSEINKKWTYTNLKKLIEEETLESPRPSWFNHDGSYNNQQFPNAIDANLFFDQDGKLWMTYGSWSGGIFLLEMDKATGKALYPGQDGTTEDGRLIDRYFGTKISGGYGKSGEGPYVVYDKETNYYYLFVTYGWLGADGGYNMRLFRSTSPEGPYVDAAGQNAVLSGNRDHAPLGIKLMGNFLFERKLGDHGIGIGFGYVSPGHNSFYTDPETGKRFLVFHTRFPQTGEMHEVRIHQMFMNKDDWPVVGPYRYAGERLEKLTKQELVGDYKFLIHGKDNSAVIKKSRSIRLNEDFTVSGDVNGTWELTGNYDAELTINDRSYHGVFVRQWDPMVKQFVSTFTVMSSEGVTLWGSKLPDPTDEEIVQAVYTDVTIGNTERVVADLSLPTEGTRNTAILWESSDENVVSKNGVITRPPVGSEPVNVTLTATIIKAEVTAIKSFAVTVVPLQR